VPCPIICLTPVKNEAWILDLFLRAASRWADHIVVCDQGSDDGSREIARSHPKVTLIDNPAKEFNEPERQRLLLEAGRAISRDALLIALDADELLSPEWEDHEEWARIRASAPGTVIQFRWANLRPGLRDYWLGGLLDLGFRDDGASPHVGRAIHSPRLPKPAGTPRIVCEAIRVLHYRSYDAARMASKHRWYQCWERLHRTGKDPVTMYRSYHSVEAVPRRKIRPFPAGWTERYAGQGIDPRAVRIEGIYRWDREVLTWFAAHGPGTFRKQSIWDADWQGLRAATPGLESAPVADPRRMRDRAAHAWLRGTQFARRFPLVQLGDWLLRRSWGAEEPLPPPVG
jgi:glycosyltransferase involved in cell wall biosynthesis